MHGWLNRRLLSRSESPVMENVTRSSQPSRALHRYALFTSFCTFCLIIAGGLVTSTQSGLAVPDWPLSYGQIMPPMVGGIFFEHTHRMVASFVGVLTIVLAIWLWRRDRRRWMRMLGLVALGGVIIQGILGGLTVLFLLPTPISVSHATLAQTFFALVAAIALFTSRWWTSRDHDQIRSEGNPSVVWLGVCVTAAVYVQLILGALMRHTHAGLAVPDFPLAYGQVFPSLSPEALARYNDELIRADIRMAADDPIRSGQVIVHMLHRVWGLLVAGLIAWTSVRVRRLRRSVPGLGRFANVLIVLLIVQITLGALTVLSLKSVAVATAHVAVGALLLVACVLLTLHGVRVFGVLVRRAPALVAPEGATI